MADRAASTVSRTRRGRGHAKALSSRRARSCSPPSKKASAFACWRRWRAGRPRSCRRIEPFTNYLSEDDALWCDPLPTPLDRRGDARVAARRRRQPSSPARAATVAARFDWAPNRAPARADLPAPDGARPCLRCASSCAGPTGVARPATRPRWSSSDLFSRRRELTRCDDFLASLAQALTDRLRPREGQIRLCLLAARSANSRASRTSGGRFRDARCRLRRYAKLSLEED